jgi:hypothetical protein
MSNHNDAMIERVADAIMHAMDRGHFNDLPPEDVRYMGWELREEWREVARAAVAAMEPEPLEKET